MIAIASVSLLPVPRPSRLKPPQPRPATLTLRPVRPSVVYSMAASWRSALDDHLLAQAAAVHLVVQADHRRPGEMPGQAVRGGAAVHQLVGHDGVDVVDA